MKRLFVVALTAEERKTLAQLLGAGVAPARKLVHARILLKADRGPEGPAFSDPAIAAALDVGKSTVARVRQRFAEEGLEAALTRRPPQREYQRSLDGAAEAQLVALACSPPPAGRAHWTMQLLADRLVVLQIVGDISDETVRRTLKKTG